MKFGLSKEEKLKSQKVIDSIFREGKSLSRYPIKVFYIPQSDILSHQAAFSVPKRTFKRAVDRNRIKRQMREAYRLNKAIIASSGKQYALFFIYIGKDKPTYNTIQKSMISLLKKSFS